MQHDPLTVKKLVNMLLDSGVEVQQVKAQFIADGTRLSDRVVRGLDGAAEEGSRSLDAGPDVLSRQQLYA